MNLIDLEKLQLKTFTEQDVLDYCQINNLNLDNITVLWLSHNSLTDISGIKLFKNLISLNLNNNCLKDISIIQYLKKIELLYINNLELESDQIQYINSLNNLKELIYYKGFKDISVLNKLNKNIRIIK